MSQGDHLDGVGTDEQEDEDEECCGVPVLGSLRFNRGLWVLGFSEEFGDDRVP